MLVREVILWASLLAIGLSVWLVTVDVVAIFRGNGWRERLWWAALAGARFFVAVAFYVLAHLTYETKSVPWSAEVVAYVVSLAGYSIASFCSIISLHPLELAVIRWADGLWPRRSSS